MKTISVFNLTQSGTFLFTEGNQKKQGTFQGLNFHNTILTRFVVRPLMRKQFECKFGKNNSKIRYQNIQFYEEMLRLNAAKINREQFEQIKFFTSQEKQRLQKIQKQIDTQKIVQLSKKFMDYSTDRKLLPQFYSKCKKISASIENLSNQIIISFEEDGIIKFLPIKLKNIDHYFQLIQNINFSPILIQNLTIDFQFVNCHYNLSKKQYEIQAFMPEEQEKIILQEGWGTIALKNINFIKPKIFAQYRKIQNKAKVSHKGIFAKPFEILSLVYTKNNLVAVVEEIIEGYIYKIRAKNNEVIKIELSKIYCPIQNEAGSFVCREFARKNLIGKQVNVFLTKDQGLNILGSIVRFVDNKDIETLMIQNGFGFVKQELKGTMFYAKLQTLQRKAKELRKGIHNEKTVGFQYYEDFTIAHSKKQKLDKKNSIQAKQRYLNQLQTGEEAVVQKCVDLVTYIVRVDSHKKMLKIRLDGVSKLISNPRLPQVSQLQKNSEAYCYRNFNQRTVNLELTQYDSTNNYFIGVIKQPGKGKQQVSFQQSLLTQGFVILYNSGMFQQKWAECEKLAKQKKIGCWSQNLRHFIRNDLFQQQDKSFIGKFSWVQDGELAFVQPNSALQKLDYVYQALNNPTQPLKSVKNEDLIPGYVCSAQYQGQICRARIISVTGKSALIRFIDWGNKENVQTNQLFDIPLKLQYIPALCCQVILDIVKPLNANEKQHLQKLREYLMELQCKFVKLYGNIVNVFALQNHINTYIVYQGYAKADLTKIHDQTTKLQIIEHMQKLRKQLVGIWDVQNNESDIDQQER